MGPQEDKRATRGLTGCKHDLPKLLALNDRNGERENLGFGGEKRRPSTGGSAKGIPESEGVRKRGLEDNKRDQSNLRRILGWKAEDAFL